MKSIIFAILVFLISLGVVEAVTQNISVVDPQYPSIYYPHLRFDMLRYNPFPVNPGEDFEIWFRITNDGNSDLEDVKFEFLEEFPFTLLKGEEALKEYTLLKKSDSILIKYKVKVDEEAIEGGNDLKLRYKASGDFWAIREFSIDVRTRDATITITSVKTDPERINPGGEAEVNILLKNGADSLMKDITVKLDLVSTGAPFTPLGATTEQKILRLNPDEEVTITFDIIADPDADSKAYKVPLEIKFFDELDNKAVENETIGLLVDIVPELELNIEQNEVYYKGATGEITISISNTGPTDIKFLSVELQNSEDYDIISPARVYLGNVESDDFETVDFKVHSKSSKVLPLGILLNYKNSYNEEFSKLETLEVQMFRKSKAVAYGLIGKERGLAHTIIYLIVIVLIYLTYKQWRKTKDIGKSIKLAVKIFLKFIVKVIKNLHPKKWKTFPSKFKQFLR